MGKFSHADVNDGCGGVVKVNATTELVCTTQPTDRATALANALADVTVATGDFTLGADGGGRKFTAAQKLAVPIDTGGNAQHIAWIDATRLLYVTTCTAQLLVAGGTVDIPAIDICKIPQPA
jgi:hypothetical protein